MNVINIKQTNSNNICHKALKFELSPESAKAIERATGHSIEELKFMPLVEKSNKKRQKVLEKNIGLVPRNIYLALGRIYTVEQAEKTIKKYLKEPFYVSLIKNIKNIFTNLICKQK